MSDSSEAGERKGEMSVIPEHLEKATLNGSKPYEEIKNELLLCIVKAIEAQTVAIREQNTLIAEGNDRTPDTRKIEDDIARLKDERVRLMARVRGSAVYGYATEWEPERRMKAEVTSTKSAIPDREEYLDRLDKLGIPRHTAIRYWEEREKNV